uniref:Uncharacterized protein n=1 Tax=Arundo donax TaxID=35708 RepID=A0A0A9A8Y1_ARUDO
MFRVSPIQITSEPGDFFSSSLIDS